MDLWFSIVDRAEQVIPENIILRTAMGAAVGWLVIAAIRPEWAYNQRGEARADAIFPELFPGSNPPTMTPWWVGPLVGAFAFATLVH